MTANETPFVQHGDADRYTAVRELTGREILDQAEHIISKLFMRGQMMNSPSAVRRYLKIAMAPLKQEVFACIFLDARHHIIEFEKLFYGTIDGASVYPREIARRCLAYNAAAVILAHNHPSGLPEPSSADRRITERVVQALALLDVRVLDHIVVGAESTTSFAERGLL